VHLKKSCILTQEEQINAVMLAMKPGLCNIFFQKYDMDRVLNYINKIKAKNVFEKD